MSNIQTVYEKGSANQNEDAYVILEEQEIYAVIDGASGLGGLTGSLASKTLAKGLREQSGSILDRVKNGNELLGKEAISAYKNNEVHTIHEIPKQHRSTCALAAIELIRDNVHKVTRMNYAAAADCMIFLQYENGKIRQITHDYMDSLDSIGIKYEQEQWNQMLSPDEDPNEWAHEKIKEVKNRIHEKAKPILAKNRQKLNTAQGYGIIDGSEEAPLYLETGTIPLVNVKNILLLTDGLKIHSHKDYVIKEEWLYSAELAFQSGLHYLLDKILEMENKDPACYFYPRFKQHDDKTGILISL